MRKTFVVSALAAALAFGVPASASADPVPPVGPPAAEGTWVPVFYFGTQVRCTRAGMLGQSIGALPPGEWMCDSGWLLRLHRGSLPATPVAAGGQLQ